MKKFLAILAFLTTTAAHAQPLLIAAASDLSYCIDALGAAFRKEAPEAQVKVSLGASGNFYAQIKSGAPFEVYMSADMAYPARLAQDGLADGASLVQYATGRLALWSLDPRFDLRQGMRVLDDARLTRLAIANPEVAPYGRAAKAALEQHGYWDAIKSKLVVGENIAQTAQFVQTGNAQLGIVSLSTVLSPRLKGVGSHYLIPDTGGAQIEQGAIVTKAGQRNRLAARFVQFLKTPAARAILAQSGFGMPREKSTAAHD